MIRAYAWALYDTSIARKLITEGNPEELEAVLTYNEHIAAGIELFYNIQRFKREEPMEISALHSAREVVSPEKHEKLQKELEGVKQQNERLMTRMMTRTVVCHFCNKVGHIARECYRKQKQQQEN